MKKLQIVWIVLFFLLLMLPVVFFEWEENVVSEIDNRQLTNNPFGENATEGADLTTQLEQYVQDRIGFRDQMISGYTQLNDKLFHKMIHPLYEYGKDGYIFSRQKENVELGEVHRDFAEMLAQIQQYCQQRGVLFLFVLDPEKAAIYPDELRDGIHYDNSWVQEFEALLEEKGVRYLDNTQLLRDKREQGEQVFNRQYNAGHWNDLGAFYGVNQMLQTLSEDFDAITPNRKEDFVIGERLNETLLSSRFPIHETEPDFGRTCPIEDKTPEYEQEIERNYQHRGFGYYLNPEKQAAGVPKTLVFQGSYLNEMGVKFLQTGLGEYIHIHNYENVLDFDYYFNIFQPECVVVEAAEYTLNDTYFNAQRLKDFSLNPALKQDDGMVQQALEQLEMTVEEGETLATVRLSLPENTQYGYLCVGERTFDLRRGEKGWEVTLEKMSWDPRKASVVLVDSQDGMTEYCRG